MEKCKDCKKRNGWGYVDPDVCEKCVNRVISRLEAELKAKDVRIKVLEEVRCEACLKLMEYMGLQPIGEIHCPRQDNAAIPCPGEPAIKKRLEKEPGREKAGQGDTVKVDEDHEPDGRNPIELSSSSDTSSAPETPAPSKEGKK